jgi:shikimate kinase
MSRNIVLCGFMGCGKSTVGRRLAKELSMPFIDMDEYIEQRAGRSVSQIFAEEGEACFRDMEHEAAVDLSRRGGVVVAAGGGTLLYERNRASLRENGVIVLLDAPLQKIAYRLRGDTTRPLLQRPDKERAMRELYEQRLPVYRAAADIAVPAGGTPAQVCRAVLQALDVQGDLEGYLRRTDGDHSN